MEDSDLDCFSDCETLISSEKFHSSCSLKTDEQLEAVSSGGGARIGGSIAERRAAKCGFNAPRISTARFWSTSPLTSPAAWSPRITIPAGISPTELLDSPILLTDSQAQPSPTKGTFPLAPLKHESPMMNDEFSRGGERSSDFRVMYKPFGTSDPMPDFSGLEDQGVGVHYQALVPDAMPLDLEFPAKFPEEVTTNSCAADSSTDVKGLGPMFVNANCELGMPNYNIANDSILLHNECVAEEDISTNYLLNGDQKRTSASMGMVNTIEDGYNWRKYGQKQVRGSEFPRSYYKCTHQNCPVKKKVERSQDGQITEIIYKGLHNHPKPKLGRRGALGSAFPYNEMLETNDVSGTSVKVEGGPALGSNDIKLGSDLKADGLERTSSTSAVTELSDLSTTQGKSVGIFESAEILELLSTVANHDDDEDRATQGSLSLGDDTDDIESYAKRRKTDSCLAEAKLVSRAGREPRVVIQIESEVDILDDGYRWRKYGQKVVKGNPNPRSYYKCTSAGCPVRKHVERASENLKCVINTYEGKHNHDVPATRNSSHASSGSGTLPQAAAANAQQTLGLHRCTRVQKPEAQGLDFIPRYDGTLQFNDYLRPTLLGSFSNDMKFPPPSMYEMKYHPMQNEISYASLGFNDNNNAACVTPVVPDFPIPLPLNLHQSANIPFPSFDFTNNLKPMGTIESFISGQQLKENDTRFLMPKQEHKDENRYDTTMLSVDQANPSSSSSSSSVNCQVTERYAS